MSKRKRRKQTKPRAEPLERQETGGTPETKAKAKAAPPSILDTLIADMMIDSAGERACSEIHRVWTGMTYESDSKVSKLSSTSHGIREMPDEVAEAYSSRFKPWFAETLPSSYWVLRILVDIGVVEPRVTNLELASSIQNYARRLT